ncbi:sensor domain-containing diguanylate cyclase [Marinobacter sp. CHS3-4]|uniref:GGDEF domain-containing protein n=1 Tax=Marinobacter sp. CHS3-4 TaxID=3045174 RepID=UPI0024B5607C|nr:sensor domain-containing diguanylate cyclase [Marinobacter sp. CHS3-4]MDI9245064.1 diguanylate cyclase [Marinobacter sp. CHS3-4]
MIEVRSESRERLAAFLESTNVGLWEWNIDTGEFHINERWAQMLGYEWSEVAPMSVKRWEELLHPLDRHSNLEKITDMLEQKTDQYDCVVRLRHKSGDWRWIHTRGVIFNDPNDGHQWFVGSHSDITEYKQAQQQLDQLAESLPGIIYTFVQKADGSRSFAYMSRKTEDFYGFPPEVGVRNPDKVFEAVHPEDLDMVNQTITQSYESLTEWVCDYRVLVGNKASWVRGISTPEKDPDGTVTWHGMVINIDQQKRLEEELKRLSVTDELTGAFNRRYILKEMEAQLQAHHRYDQPFSLISIDIDHFKSTNDNFGHVFGDEVLRAFAEIVQSRIRETDSFARIGGEEFLILMPHTRLNDAYTLAEDLRESFQNHVLKPSEEQSYHVTLSAGVLECSGPELATVADLLLACDKSLYQAKHEGRNRAVTYQP